MKEEGFVIYDDSDLNMGQKFYFRCSRIPKDRKRSEWCSRRYIIFLPSQSNDIILLTNDEEHNHNELSKGKKRLISPEMLVFIHDLYKKETKKASSVILHIDAARREQQLFVDEPNPTNKQLEYILKKFNSKETGKLIHLGDLAKWCEEKCNYPTNGDEAFVLSHEIITTKEKQGFHFTVTTPNLLKKLSKMKTICIDATYKLNWMGFPLVVLGTVDRKKHFHPMLYGCTSHETTDDYIFVFNSIKIGAATYFPSNNFSPKTLIADGADQIRSAYYKVFECAERDIMCFAHVVRNIRKRPFAAKLNKALIIDDIRRMQLAPSPSAFGVMSKLFITKWQDIEPNFVSYFQQQWLGTHVNWYEGEAHYTPSTNNALESHNSVIKKKITFRRRLPLEEFLPAMLKMTTDISKQLSEGIRIVASEPDISRDVMMRAAHMNNNGFQAFKATTKSNRVFYVLPAKKCANENSNYKYYQSLVKREWTSFDEYINYGFQMFWTVNFVIDEWNKKSTCSCPFFFKQFICKHVVAIAIQKKIIECPQSANPTLIAPRRGPGRAKNATYALMR